MNHQHQPSLWLLVSFYNESTNLERCHQSVVEPFPDYIVRPVFVDGAYPSRSSDLIDYMSTDESFDYAITNGQYIPLHSDETTKHNAGLSIIDRWAQRGDKILMLDADEEIASIYTTYPYVGIISFERDSDGVDYDRARLFTWEPGLHFITRHDLVDADRNPIADLIDGIDAATVGVGVHHDIISPDRQRAKDKFYRTLQEYESANNLVPTQGGFNATKV